MAPPGCHPDTLSATKERLRRTEPTWTIVGSFFEPSANSSYVSLWSWLKSIVLKIFVTRFSGVSSSGGSLTMAPVIL